MHKTRALSERKATLFPTHLMLAQSCGSRGAVNAQFGYEGRALSNMNDILAY